MVFLNEQNGKRKLRSLVDRLSSAVDRRRKYCLVLATGYFRKKAADRLINKLINILNIQEIELYLPRSIAVQEENALDDMIADHRNLCVYPIRGNFFHTKAYCLVSYDDWNSDDPKVTGGCLAIGSANLTGNGMVSKSGNIESLVVSDDLQQIEEFINSLYNINWIEFEDLHKYKYNDKHDFRYSLLSQGEFAYKYTTNLNEYLAVKYNLSRKSKDTQQQGFDELGIPEGFETETSTISKQYFDFDIDPFRPEGYRDLIKNYGIECWGYWIPKIVVPSLRNERFEFFKTNMFREIRNQMESITSKIKNDYDTLVDGGIIEIDADKGDPSENFRCKVDELEADDDRLFRIWSQLAFNDFPYDRNDTQNIDNIYGNVITTIELSKRKNSTKWAVIELHNLFEQGEKFTMPRFSLDEDGKVQLEWRNGMGE